MNKLHGFILKLISSFFFVGFLLPIPGTYGSLVALAIFFLAKEYLIFYTLFFIVAGFLTAGKTERLLGVKDARCIVIDEVSGMSLSLLFVPYDIKLVVIGFIFFRLLDTLKPYPANKLQDLSGSLGIMADDLIAGLYTNVLLQVISRVLLRM